MALTPVPVEGFGGLDLRSDPAEVGWGRAIDIKNVDLDLRGRVRSRDGSSALTTSTIASGCLMAFDNGGDGQLIAETPSGATFVALDNTGAVLATSVSSGATATPSSMVRFAASGSTYAYCTKIGGSPSTVVRWNGVSWDTPASLPAARFLGVTPWDNRLVASDNATSTVHRLRFSDAGAPETFGSTNYIDLRPGDGEPITGIAAWNNYLFVFKRTIFYRFYGTSTDTTGGPIFNYAPIDTGIGAVQTQAAVAAGPEGVYFLATDGVYITTGGTPTKISGALDPLFANRATLFSGISTSGLYVSATSTFKLSYSKRRLFLHTGGYSTFVYDPQLDAWMWWALDMGYTTTFKSSASAAAQTFYAMSLYYSRVRWIDPSQTTDAGDSSGVPTAIDSFYRSGFADLGLPGREKTVRETELVGTGAVQMSWARDYGAVTTTSQGNVTLGTSPAVARKSHRKSQPGELLSFKLASVSNGAWLVDRLNAYVRMPAREPAQSTT